MRVDESTNLKISLKAFRVSNGIIHDYSAMRALNKAHTVLTKLLNNI